MWQHCLLTWIQQDSSKGLCPMCRQSKVCLFYTTICTDWIHQNSNGSKAGNDHFPIWGVTFLLLGFLASEHHQRLLWRWQHKIPKSVFCLGLDLACHISYD